MQIAALLILALASACEVVVPSNPFDPGTPADQQAPGVLQGSIELVDSFDPDARLRQLNAIRIGLIDESGQRLKSSGDVVSVVLDDVDGGADADRASGVFEINDLRPGVYGVVVEGVPGFYQAPELPTVRVVAGGNADVSALVFTFVGDGNDGPGLIKGEVRAEGGALGQASVRLFVRRDGDVELVRELASSPAADNLATFSFPALPIGSYAVVVQSAGFVPAYRLDLEVGEGEGAALVQRFEGADAIRLFAGRSALAISPGATTRLQDGGFYTRGDNVDVAVLPFGAAATGVTGMRLSSDPSFLDAAGAALAFVPVQEAATVTLPDTDGVVQVFLQLEANSGAFNFSSEVFATALVRDTVAPRIVDATLLGLQRDVDGVFLAPSSSLAVRVEATDDHSAVAGFDVAVGASAAALTQTSSPPGQVRLEKTVGSGGDGEVVVFVGVEDRAGNRAPDLLLHALVDTSAPDVALLVANAAGGLLPTRSALLDFDQSGALSDLPVAMQVRALGQAFSDDLPYGPATVFVDSSLGLGDGDVVTFEARLFDRVGNEALLSRDVTLQLQGAFVGRVAAAGVPLLTPSALGAQVTVRGPAGNVVASDDVDADGLFVLAAVPEGTGYAVEVSLDGYRSARRPGLVMPSPAADGAPTVVDLEVVDLALAQGDLAARFRREDLANVDDAHAGIIVTVNLRSPERVFSRSLPSDASGDVVFADLPATRVGESYDLVARRDDYGVGTVGGLLVTDAALSSAPLALLPRNVGDFDVCAPTGPCVPSRFFNTSAVRVKLRDPSDVLRLLVSINGAAEESIALAADNLTLVNLPGAVDGEITLALRTQSSDGSNSVPLAAAIVRDTVAPTSVTLTRSAAAGSVDARFTSLEFVDVVLSADPGSGIVAPLAAPRIVIADVEPATPPAEVGCSHASLCRLGLPGAGIGAVEEKLQRVFAFSCDQAGNCADAAQTFVIFDETPPTPAHGASFNINATGSVLEGGAVPVRVLPSPFYAGQIELGSAKTGSDDDVVDELALPVADVFAFRTSLGAQTLARAALQTFSDPPAAGALRDGADVGVPALLPITGVQTIFGELVDAAGNVSAPIAVAVRVDVSPPSAVFVVNGGLPTANQQVPFTLTVPAGGEAPVAVAIAVDEGASVLFALPLSGAERLTLPNVEGSHRVVANALDLVGNAARTEVSIVLDQSGPRIDAVRCVDAECSDDGFGTLLSRAADGRIDLAVNASDALSGVKTIEVSVNGGAVQSFAANAVNNVLLSVNAASTLSLVAVDGVGNRGAAFLRSASHDTAGPNISAFAIAAGVAATNSAQVAVHTEVPAGDAVEMRLSTTNSFSGPFSSFRADDFFLLSGADGAKQVCVQVRDAAGNADDACDSVLLDRVAPSGSLAVVGSALSASTNINVRLSYPADTVSVAISNSALSCESQATPYVAATGSPQNALVVVDAGDGVRPLFACFKDAAANVAAASASVLLDQSAPAVVALLDGGAAFTIDDSVGLDVDADADVAGMAVVIDAALDCSNASYGPFEAATTRTLPLSEGTHTLSVCVVDTAGNRSPQPSTASIFFDRSDPVGSLVLDGAALFTRSTTLTAALTRSVDVVAMAVEVSDTLNCATASYTSFQPTIALGLSGSDGLRTVQACLKDSAGRTARVQDSITLDRTAPNGSVVVAGGATTTAARDVSAALTFAADTTAIAVSAFPIACDTAVFLAPAANVNVSLPFAGQNTVTACLKDGAGNIAAVTDDIFLEDNAGDSLVIAIAGGATSVDNRNVVVSLFRPSSDFTEMKVVEAPALDCADPSGYEAFNSTKNLTLSAGAAPFEGTRSLSACVKNPLNLATKAASDSIFLDTFNPDGSVSINAGAAVTGSASIAVTLANNFAGQNESISVALSETSTLVSGDCGGSFEAFSANKSFNLSGADGSRNVFACLRDAAGNTREVSDTIVLDRAAPSPVSLSAAPLGRLTAVAVTLTFPADAVQVALAEGALDCATTTSYQAAPASSPALLSLNIAAIDGPHTLFACFRDAANNATQASAVTSLDRTAPVATVVVDAAAAFTTDRDVQVAVQNVADAVRMARVEAAVAPSCDAVVYEAFQSVTNFPISSAGDGTKTLHVCLEDAAGNRALALSDSIVLDTSAPNATLVINDGAAATRERAVSLAIGIGSATDVSAFAVAESTIACNAANLAYSPFASLLPFTVSAGDGSKSVLVCLKDNAGNVSTAAGSDTINLDTAPVVGPVVAISDGDGFVQNEGTINVALSWTTAGDAALGKVAEGAIDCQSPAGYVALPVGATNFTFSNVAVSAPQGSKLFVACVQDVAGNSVSAQDQTLRDSVAPTVTSITCSDCSSDGTTIFTTDAAVALALGSDEGGSGLASALVSVDGGADAAATLTNGVVNVSSLAAGNRSLRLKLRDAAGNVSADAQSKTIALTFDNVAPTLASLTLDGGVAVVNDANVDVAIGGAATDTVAMAVAEVSGGGPAIANCAAATYSPFVPGFVRSLPAGDGLKAVSVCLKDAAGNKSAAVVTTTVTLDAVAPSLPALPVAIVDGDGFLQAETTVSVLLSWTTIGDARFAKVGEVVDCQSSSGYSALPAAANSTTVTSVPVAAGDGPKILSACFKDLGGNISVGQDSTVRDAAAPTVTSLACTDCAVDGAILFSTDSVIALAVSSDEAGSGIASALVSVDGGADSAASVDNGVVTVLGLAQGNRVVRVRLIDRAGNVSSVAQAKSVAISVDTTRPALASNADFRLNGQNSGGFTNDAALTVSIVSPPIDAVQMALVEAATLNCATAVYVPLATTFTFAVSSASQGAKSVQLCLLDRAGNTSASAHSASITFDTVAPSLPATAVIVQDGGDELLGSVAGGVSVRLNWNVVGDVSAFKLGENSVDCSSEPYEVPAGLGTLNTFLRTAFPLSTVDGTKVVVACFKDAAGNIVSAQDTTVLDQVGPNGALAINTGAAFTTAASEDVSATLRMSLDVGRFFVAETTAANPTCATPTVNCSSASYEAFSSVVVDGVRVATKALNLIGAPASENQKCFEACFEDTAGNKSSAAALDAIVFDKTAPGLLAADITLLGLDKNGSSAVRTRSPFITVAIANAAADTTLMRVSEDGAFAGGTQSFLPFSAAAQQITLSSGDATKNVFVQLKDAAGNVGAAISKSIIFDTTAPNGAALVLAAGALATKNASISAALQASGATEMKILTPDNDVDSEAFVAFTTAATVIVEDAAAPAGDGPKTVLVVFRDDAGNEAGAASDGIDLDRSGPTAPSVVINAGSAVTNNTVVTLTFGVVGATEMQVVTDGSADTEPFVPFSETLVAAIASGDCSPGVLCKTVQARFRDAADNRSAFVNDTISLDTVAPSAVALTLTSSVAGDALNFSSSTNVDASFAYATGAGQAVAIKHAEGSVDCGSAAGYVNLDGTSPDVATGIVLSSGDGQKTYVSCFKDAAGNIASASDSLTLDTALPTVAAFIKLRGSSSSEPSAVNTRDVALRLTALSADVTQVAVVDGALTCASASYSGLPLPLGPVPFDIDATLAATPEGLHTLRLCVKDSAGNVSATAASDTVTLDTVVPQSVSASINAGATLANTTAVSVAVGFVVGDAREAKVAESSIDCADSSGYSALGATSPENRSFTLSTDDGLKTVLVCLRDLAGNTSSASDTITLDRLAPAGSVTIDADAAFSLDTSVALNFQNVSADVTLVSTSTTLPNCASATYVAFAGDIAAFALGATQGTRSVFVCLKDSAGNVTPTPLADSIFVDTVAPTLSSVTLAAIVTVPAAAFTPIRDVLATINGIPVDAAALAIADAATLSCASAAYTPLALPTPASVALPVQLSGAAGLRTVFVCVKDNAGNTSAAATSGTITLDDGPPNVPVSINSAAVFSTSSTVSLGLSPSPAGDLLRRLLSNDPSIDCAVQVYSGAFAVQPASIASQVLSSGDGERSLAVCFQDQAGNTSRFGDSIIVDATPPAATFAISNGAAFSTSTSATADFSDVVDANGPLQLKTSTGAINCALAAGYVAFTNASSLTLGGVDGSKTVLACLKDQAGNTTQFSDSISLDQTNPTIAFTIERAGQPAPTAAFSNSLNVVVRVSALAADSLSFAIKEGAIDCSTASFTLLPAPLPSLPVNVAFDLADLADGAKTLSVCVKDGAGRTNGTLGTTSTVTLDRTPPEIDATINDGDSVTGNDAVVVTLASAPVGDLLRQQSSPAFRSNPVVDCSGADFSGAFAVLPATRNATLDNGAQFNDSGTKFIAACFQDQAGNVAAAVDDIFFDEDRPGFAGRPQCSGCNLVDATPSFLLTFNDDVLGFTNEANTVDWEVTPSAADTLFILAMATTDGNQLTGDLGDDRVCTLDSQCNVAAGETCVDFPVDDQASPAPPIIAKRCALVSVPEAPLAPLLPIEGKFEIITALVDSAGNFSNARELFVIRDTVAPTVSFVLNQSNSTSQTVFVRNLTVSGEVAVAAVARLGTFLASSLVTFADVSPLTYTDVTAPFVLSDAIPVNLSAGDGSKNVLVRFTDNAGNTPAVDASQTVFLDTTAPTRPIFSTQSVVVGPLSAAVSVALASVSTDTSGSGLRSPRNYDLLLPTGVGCAALDGAATETNLLSPDCQWSGTAFNVSTAALGTDGDKRIFVHALDTAGNASEQDLLTLTLDTVAPTKPCFASGCATPATLFSAAADITLNLNLQSSDLHFASYQACTTTAATCSCTPADVPGATFTALLSPNATNRVCVRARDEANNVSAFDTQLVVHDDVAPSAPLFTSPLTEVTGAKTLLLFSPSSTSHTDPNFSHFAVIGGGHVDTLELCATATAPLCNTATRSRFFLNGTTPVSLLVDLESETSNKFSIQAVDRAGNASGTAVVELFEGSLTIARATSEKPNSETMVAFGDRVAFLINDNLFDETDSARVIGPGLDLRFGTSDDENVQFSTTVLHDSNTAAAAFDGTSRQTTPVSGGSSGLAFIDPSNDDATHAGHLRLRTYGSDTVFNGNDSLIFLTPFPSAAAPSGCGQQKGYRNPSMSQDHIVVSCFFSDTDHDIFMFTPGINGVYEATGAVGRDDTFTSLASSGAREELPVLSDETAAWMLEVSADSFSVQVRRPGPDGRLASATPDDVTGIAATGIAAALVTQPGLYFPEDPSVPGCQRGVVYVASGRTIVHHNPGPDGIFAATGGDDVRTIIESLTNNGNVGALRIGSGVITYDNGFLDGQVVISPGPNRCYEAEGAVGSDDERTETLTAFGTAAVTVANGGWFEFSTPGIFLNQVLFHDLLTRRALVDGQENSVGDAIMGGGFALFANGSGNIKVFDFDADDLVVRSRTDAAIFNRSFTSFGAKIASIDEDVDALNIVEPGADSDLLTSDDTTIVVATDATGGAVIDDIAGSEHNFGMSNTVLAFLTGIDPASGYPSANVRIQFAGADGTFQRDGVGAEDDCQVNVTGAAAQRGFVNVDNTRVIWLDRTIANSDAGLVQAFEPNSATLPCNGGTITQLTNAAFPQATLPVTVGNRVAAFETDSLGAPLGLLIFDTPSNYRTLTNRRRSCRLPTGWDVVGSDALAFFEGGAVFVIEQSGLRKTAMCDLGNDTVRMLDANQPGPGSVSSSGRTFVMRSFADDSVLQMQLDR